MNGPHLKRSLSPFHGLDDISNNFNKPNRCSITRAKHCSQRDVTETCSRSHVSPRRGWPVRASVSGSEILKKPNIPASIVDAHEHVNIRHPDAQRSSQSGTTGSHSLRHGCLTASPSWQNRCISSAFVEIAHRQPRGCQAIVPCASVSAINLETKDCLLI